MSNQKLYLLNATEKVISHLADIGKKFKIPRNIKNELTMKTLILTCLSLATTLSLNAQEKPTREQTLQYLNSVLIGQEGGAYFRAGREAKKEHLFEFLRITLNDNDVSGTDDCTLTYRFEEIKRYSGYSGFQPSDKSENWARHFDLLKIESFVFKRENVSDYDALVSSRSGGVRMSKYEHYNDNVLLFYDTPEAKGLKAEGFYCPPEHAEKVLKALNHLRKLCGAPEAISFD